MNPLLLLGDLFQRGSLKLRPSTQHLRLWQACLWQYESSADLLRLSEPGPHNAALLQKQISTSSDRRYKSCLHSFSPLLFLLQQFSWTLPPHIISHRERHGQTVSLLLVSGYSSHFEDFMWCFFFFFKFNSHGAALNSYVWGNNLILRRCCFILKIN